MTTSDEPEFEVTVGGGIGPVLRHALGPDLEAQTHRCTTLLAETAEDVATLVAQLQAYGLRVESVFIVRPAIATL